jgi:hypothetical protein
MLSALLSFIGTMLILRSWIAAEPSMRSALAVPRTAAVKGDGDQQARALQESVLSGSRRDYVPRCR